MVAIFQGFVVRQLAGVQFGCGNVFLEQHTPRCSAVPLVVIIHSLVSAFIGVIRGLRARVLAVRRAPCDTTCERQDHDSAPTN